MRQAETALELAVAAGPVRELLRANKHIGTAKPFPADSDLTALAS